MKQDCLPMDRIDYSMDEKVVGTWMGKPLYQKTVKPNLPSSVTDGTIAREVTSFSALGINNPDVGFVVTGVAIFKTGGSLSAVNATFQNPGSNYIYYVSVQFQKGSDGLDVRTNRSSYTSANADLYVTVQYTKTTD